MISRKKYLRLCLYISIIFFISPSTQAQLSTLGDGPWFYDTYSPQSKIKLSVITKGLDHAWSLAFLPSGEVLVSEREGLLRVIREGELDPTPIAGMPEVASIGSAGLMDIALHPDFTENRLVYFAYVKAGQVPEGASLYTTHVLARGRLNAEATAITEVEDLLIGEAWSSNNGGNGARIIFGPDHTIYMSQPFRREPDGPQNNTNHIGALLRLNADASIPADNPFVGDPSALPEIYSYGHRAIEGMIFHPDSKELWVVEHGPQGGDEVNIIQPGGNYGWPLVTYGRDYSGREVVEVPVNENTLPPEIFWVPSIATSGMMFYTGDKFPQWHNHLFVGGLMSGRVPGTGHIQRIEFNQNGEQKRERLLTELGQRIRDIRQGPDGLIYILTDEVNGALLVIEPAPSL